METVTHCNHIRSLSAWKYCVRFHEKNNLVAYDLLEINLLDFDFIVSILNLNRHGQLILLNHKTKFFRLTRNSASLGIYVVHNYHNVIIFADKRLRSPPWPWRVFICSLIGLEFPVSYWLHCSAVKYIQNRVRVGLYSSTNHDVHF